MSNIKIVLCYDYFYVLSYFCILLYAVLDLTVIIIYKWSTSCNIKKYSLMFELSTKGESKGSARFT